MRDNASRILRESTCYERVPFAYRFTTTGRLSQTEKDENTLLVINRTYIQAEHALTYRTDYISA